MVEKGDPGDFQSASVLSYSGWTQVGWSVEASKPIRNSTGLRFEVECLEGFGCIFSGALAIIQRLQLLRLQGWPSA